MSSAYRIGPIVTVSGGVTITPGTSGLVAFRGSGTVTVAGTISATGYGYAGGPSGSQYESPSSGGYSFCGLGGGSGSGVGNGTGGSATCGGGGGGGDGRWRWPCRCWFRSKGVPEAVEERITTADLVVALAQVEAMDQEESMETVAEAMLLMEEQHRATVDLEG